MFINQQPSTLVEEYKYLLQIIGGLSRLSSDRLEPFLYYRMAENIFCMAFGADNLSRSDTAIDVKKDKIGIGLKTFLHKNGKSFEKISEFNKERDLFKSYESDPKKLVNIICDLRNKRIDIASNIHGASKDKFLYHCVTRAPNLFKIHESKMSSINIEKINDVKKKDNNIWFNDGINDYNFSLSKSTLFQRFIIKPVFEVDSKIIENPFDILKDIITKMQPLHKITFKESIILPLYSKDKKIPERSGLNQFRAKGRDRDANEIYIPVPAWIHKKFSNFFPPREVSFDLSLPNKKILQVKLCQDGSKALMSNPNKDLGQWLLRDVLQLKEGKLLTYKMLEEIGIDSVEISKDSHDKFYINFKEQGSYEDFEETYNIN